jgi:hypothetical protein
MPKSVSDSSVTVNAKHAMPAVAALSCVLIFAVACTQSRVAKTSRQLVEQIAQSPEVAKPVPGRAAPAQEHRVYLDGSVSMGGFVNPLNHTTFDNLLDEIGTDLPGSQLYLYGQSGEQPPQSISELTRRIGFSREMHNPGFYNLTYNPDHLLIEALGNEEKPVLSALITDGVYSEPMGGTTPPVVEAISKFMQKGMMLGILVFKSAFKGPFYSEHRRAMLSSVSVEARPFYVFVFSPTELDFRNLQEKLQQRFPQMQSILFSNNAVSCSIDSAKDQQWVYSSIDAPRESYYWQMFNDGLINQKNSGLVSYDLSYQSAPEYPAAEFKPNIRQFYSLCV